MQALMAEGAIVVAAGGGGIPMVRDDGRLRGVEAVLDKDLTAALLARTVGADCLLIATDVAGRGDRLRHRPPGVARRGRALTGCASCTRPASSAEAAWARRSRPRWPSEGRSVITSLERLREGVEGSAGTQVAP